jgi:polyphenol oxidase
MRFDLPGGGRVLFTTREHGNMSSVGGDGAEHGAQARERLCTQIGVRRLARGYQVHGSVVRRICAEGDISERDTAAVHPTVEADGHATALPGIGAMALTADCLPVALGSPRAVAMLHAGWRGLAANVLEEGVRALREVGAEDADGEETVVAVIGPAAGVCCYEVGPEVHAAFGDIQQERQHIDLKAIARDRLLAAGVDRVHDVGLCTICDERFFSHRRDGSRAGRQAGIAWLE